MSKTASTPRLVDHPFFRGFPGELPRLLERHASFRSYETGELLLREGDNAEEVFFLHHGKVALEIVLPDRPKITVQTLGPGDVLGWSWLLAPYRWRLDARALKATSAIGVAASHLRSMLESRPEDGYRFLLRLVDVVTRRLESTRLQLLDLHGR